VVARKPPYSFRTWFLFAVLGAVGPLLVLAAVTLVWIARNSQAVRDQTHGDAARALAAAVDGELRSWKTALNTLAASTALTRRDFAAFYEEARAVGAAHDGWVVLTDGNQQQVLNTLRPYGEALPKSVPVFRQVFAERQPVVSDLFVGAVAQRHVVSVAVPVLRGNEVMFTLDLAFTPERLSALLSGDKLPETRVQSVTDAQGRIVARSRNADQRVGQVSAEWFRAAVAAAPAGILTGESALGGRYRTAFQRMQEAPWTVSLAIPLAEVTSVWRWPLLGFAGIALVLVAVAGATAAHVGRSVALPVRALADSAEAVLRGEAPAAGRLSPVREIQGLNAALADASEKLRAYHEGRARLARAEEAAATAAAVRESEQRLQSAKAAARLGVYDHDLKSGALQWDERVRELWGVGPDEPVTHEVFLAGLHPDDRAATQAALDRALDPSGDGRYSAEYRVVGRGDGATRWVNATGQVFFQEGHATRLIGTVLDVSDRKQSEEALRGVLQRLDAHIGNSPLAVVEFDRTFRVTRWSDEAERLFGWSAGEVLGKTISELRWVHEDDVARVERISAEMLAGHHTRNVHGNRNYRKDGTVVHCEWYNSALYDADGRLTSILSSVLDTTARHHAEVALRESEERFRLFMDNSPTIAWVKDEQGRHVYLSKTYEDSFGVRLEEWRGRTDAEVWPPDVAAGFRRNDEIVLATNRPLAVAEEATMPGGERRFWLNTKFPFRDSSGRRYVAGIGVDITESRRTEEQLRAALVANQTLLREVHHRTKNNLQMLCDLLYLQAAQLDSAEAKTVLDEAYGRIFAIARLHEQLYQSFGSGAIRLAEYLNRIIAGCGDVHRNVSMVLDAPDDALALDVDRAIHLGLVVNELLINAVKHGFPSGGSGAVRIGVRRVADRVEVQVRDNGKGLPAGLEVERAKSLGLRIVHILTNRLGGRVRIENDNGAVFTLAFPLHAEAPVTPDREEPRAA
jgi:PAS domain S-box-containing protein